MVIEPQCAVITHRACMRRAPGSGDFLGRTLAYIPAAAKAARLHAD